MKPEFIWGQHCGDLQNRSSLGIYDFFLTMLPKNPVTQLMLILYVSDVFKVFKLSLFQLIHFLCRTSNNSLIYSFSKMVHICNSSWKPENSELVLYKVILYSNRNKIFKKPLKRNMLVVNAEFIVLLPKRKRVSSIITVSGLSNLGKQKQRAQSSPKGT